MSGRGKIGRGEEREVLLPGVGFVAGHFDNDPEADAGEEAGPEVAAV